MDKRKILVIDETIREGMQFQGVMFSKEQRLKILEFQEKLGIDICQAGYPPAHESELKAVRTMVDFARGKAFRIRIAAMGRANMKDAETLISSGSDDFHFHIHIKNSPPENELKKVLLSLQELIRHLKTHHPGHHVSIAVLDIGKCSPDLLGRCTDFFEAQELDILSLPDTSGLLSPTQIFKSIRHLSGRCSQTTLSVHCHNDMGMAAANSVTGIEAGAGILEASALGIGERNGISDLFTAGKMLREKGYDLSLNTDDIATFRAYYEYIDSIVYDQTGIRLLTPCTPVFGKAVETHVAGTHANGDFGCSEDETFTLNVLCGRKLVKKYLEIHHVDCPENDLHELTSKIKDQSVRLNRPMNIDDVKNILSKSQQ